MSKAKEMLDELAADIVRKREALLLADGQYQKRNPTASDIDPDGCLRRQVLSIVKWDERKPFDVHARARMQAGNYIEREANRELLEIGYDVIRQQERFELPYRQRRSKPKRQTICLSGKIDGLIGVRTASKSYRLHDWFLIEIKSITPRQYALINSLDDLRANIWYRKYFYQIQAYLIGLGIEACMLRMTDCLGHWKSFVIELDYDEAERVWSYAESIVDAVDEYQATKKLPPETDDKMQCFRCDFFKRSCQPEFETEGAYMYANGMLEKGLDERAEVEKNGREYSRLDRKVKKWLKDFETDPKLKDKRMFIVGKHALELKIQKGGKRVWKIEAMDPESTEVVEVES